MTQSVPPTGPYCSFCGKSRHEIQRMVSGPSDTVFICDECISLSMQIIADLEPGPGQADSGAFDREGHSKYLGTIRNWSGYSTEKLIELFRMEDKYERELGAWRAARLKAMFMTLQGRGLTFEETWDALDTIPKWNEPPDLSEFNDARDKLKKICENEHCDEEITRQELFLSIKAFFTAQDQIKRNNFIRHHTKSIETAPTIDTTITCTNNGQLSWNGESISAHDLSLRIGKDGHESEETV